MRLHCDWTAAFQLQPNGWGGRHPIGVPIVVITHGKIPKKWISEHSGAPFTFVTEGIASAIERARAIAGVKDVAVAGPNVIQQCINLGLMDEICISLVPVLIGDGIPFFGKLTKSPVKLVSRPASLCPISNLSYV